MTFEPKTFNVDLVAIAGPDDRARAVINALPAAAQKLGTQPTHVLADSNLRINIEMLNEAGLRLRRRSVSWVSRYLVMLAVEVPPGPRSRGGPARTPVQARLV